ncbi:MAG: hypothetical protein V1910_02625 [bacterium]
MEEIKNTEQINKDLIEKINSCLKEILSNNFYNIYELPHLSEEEKEKMKNEKILIIDDKKNVIIKYLPILMTATNGNSSGLLCMYNNFELNDLSEKIISEKPSVVLIDNDLSSDFEGPDLVKVLKVNKFTGKIFGFSSNSDSKKKFLEEGANNFIDKDMNDPKFLISSIIDYLEKK